MQLPALLLAAAPAAKPTGAAPAKNISAATAKAVPKVKAAAGERQTAAIKIASTAKVASPILAEPNVGAMPKMISRHVQNVTHPADRTMPAEAAKAHLRAARAVGSSAIAHLSSSSRQNASDLLLHASVECECHFTDMCGCQSAMAFMTCVARACASGACDCRKYEFMDACGAIANTCPDLAINCRHERAECIHEEVAMPAEVVYAPKPVLTKEEIYDKLRELKEEKCRLQVAMNDGWLNAKGQLEETNLEIQKLIDQLATLGEKMPEMHCEKHFEEWHDPPSTPAPPKKEEPEEKPENEEPEKKAAKIEKPEAEEPEPTVTPAPEPLAGGKKRVPLWSAPARSGAERQAPLLLAAGLVATLLALK